MRNTRERSQEILLSVGTNEVEFLKFHLGIQSFGINVGKVRHIALYEPKSVVFIPNQHSSVIGVISFRDQIISVVDLGKHLGIPLPEIDNARRLILVTEFNKHTVAFLIDGVDRIERCSWEQFDSMSSMVSNEESCAVVGTVTLHDSIVVILDVEAILGALDPTTTIAHYEATLPPETIDRSNISIVYCEDSSIVKKMLLNTLTQAGFKKFQVFSTGAEGLQYLKSVHPREVDIILSDIEMPKMDGLTLCREVRSIPQLEKVPFVFFSSMINEQMEVKCRSVGGDACFAKPQIQLIVDSIEKLVGRGREN